MRVEYTLSSSRVSSSPSTGGPSSSLITLSIVLGVLVVIANAIILPVVWTEVTRTWNEFDAHMEEVRDLSTQIDSTLRSIDVQPSRETRQMNRARFDAASAAEPETSEERRVKAIRKVRRHRFVLRNGTVSTEVLYEAETESPESADSAPNAPPPEAADSAPNAPPPPEFLDAPRLPCNCRASNGCPPGPPGERGVKGDDGHVGPDGQDGGNGQDALDLPSPLVPTECVLCPTGEEGLPGKGGQYGSRGVRGPHGRPGRQGEDGMPGVNGEPGPTGRQGRTGDSGARGVRGEDGIKPDRRQGRKGVRGPQGVEGPPGDQGYPGVVPGVRGHRGAPGAEGPPGERGRAGRIGWPGVRGQRGQIGECNCTVLYPKKGESEEDREPIDLPEARGSFDGAQPPGEAHAPGSSEISIDVQRAPTRLNTPSDIDRHFMPAHASAPQSMEVHEYTDGPVQRPGEHRTETTTTTRPTTQDIRRAPLNPVIVVKPLRASAHAGRTAARVTLSAAEDRAPATTTASPIQPLPPIEQVSDAERRWREQHNFDASFAEIVGPQPAAAHPTHRARPHSSPLNWQPEMRRLL